MLGKWFVHGGVAGSFLAGPLLTVVALALLPGGFEQNAASLLRGICAQRPDHAFPTEGAPVVLEARLLGLFGAFAAATLAALLGNRSHRVELPPPRVAALCGALGLALAVDGLNAVAWDLGAGFAYAPDNALRLATGLAGGAAFAAYALPVIAYVVWKARVRAPLSPGVRELVLPPLVAGGAVAGGAVAGWASLLAFLALVFVALSMWVVNTYMAVLAWWGAGRIESWGAARAPALVGYVLTIAELLALAWARTWAEGALGIRWMV